MSLPWQQGSAPQHFAWFHWIGHPRKPPSRPIHLRSICHTSRLTGDFVQLQILGSKFWALGGLNQKSKTKFCRVPHREMTAKKWLDSIQKQKRRISLKEQCDRQDRQTQRQTRKLCYRKDDRAMRPIGLHGCPENFRESLTTPTATILNIFHGLLFGSTLWMFPQNLKFVALPVPEIITPKIWALPGYAHAPFLRNF